MSRGPKKKEKTLAKELGVLLAKTLLPDLRSRAKSGAVDAVLRQRWEHERGDDRTAERFEDWADQLIEQVGAAWVLSCVFVRTLEDRGLVSRRRIAGEGAADSEHYFYEIAPSLNARDYLLTIFKELSRFPGTEELLGPRGNPAWRLAPSGVAAQALLDFFRETKEDGALRWTFGAPAAGGDGRAAESSTRFLGDLYQDLSESVRERYALLQTPDFVERFILGLTLDPAIREFGLEEVRVIDPTCGSGHFLLGAYERLFEARLAEKPGLDRRVHALAALEQVFGVDINPYAVAIARFRLTLAYIEKSGEKLGEVPKLPDNLVVADSLLYAAKGSQADLAERASSKKEWGDSLFTLENPERANSVLSRGYHVVVGNPPYITCKDAKLRDRYRKLYQSCHREYALAAPFTERFFQLAVKSGFVGLINANSFMKREFGKRLIEQVLKSLDLTCVIDTSGAFIPGHGTPTVLLFGRNRPPSGDEVHAVLGKRGEPETPGDPATGKVWTSITRQFSKPGHEDEYISVSSLPRATLARHPWSLGGGGAAGLKELLDERAVSRLCDHVSSIGFGCITKMDDVFCQPRHVLVRHRVEADFVRPFGIGEDIRDWSAAQGNWVIFPYDVAIETVPVSSIPNAVRLMWPNRETLLDRKVFGGETYREVGKPWYEYGQIPKDRYTTKLSIAFAEVATHNHFVLDRGGKVFKQTAPIIKLPEGATEEDHLGLLGYLNSSVAGFWMKQVCMNKGAQGINEGIKTEAWEQFTQRSGTALGKAPVPRLDGAAVFIVNRICRLAERREEEMPFSVFTRWTPGRVPLPKELERHEHVAAGILAKMCALQEELDWLLYSAFGLLDTEDELLVEQARSEVWAGFSAPINESANSLERDGLHPGHRAFEVVLARECLENGQSTAWFERNGYRSPTEIPATYSQACQRLIEARVAIIDRSPQIRLIEKPEFKRRWTLRSFAEEARAAAAAWLLERAEQIARDSPSPRSVRQVETELLQLPGALEVATWLFGEDAAAGVRTLVFDEAVPYVAVARFTAVGVEKHAAWQRTWDLQRREDAGEKDLKIPVPPKYDQKDYRDPIYWHLRGKLDVPKERFISYPGAERDDDRSPLIGWAGWDHLQRAQALATLYQERKNQDGWEKERLQPLLAGLLELVPWLKQWHNAPDDDPAKDRAGDAYATFVETEARALGFTLDDLRAWRPEEKKGRKNGKARVVEPANGAADKQLTMPLSLEDAAPTPAKKPRRKKAKSEEAAE